MNIVRRQRTDLAQVSRRGFLKALGTLVAATAAAKVLDPLEKVVKKLEPENGILLADGSRVVLGDWVESAKYETIKVASTAKLETQATIRAYLHGLHHRPPPTAARPRARTPARGRTHRR